MRQRLASIAFSLAVLAAFPTNAQRSYDPRAGCPTLPKDSYVIVISGALVLIALVLLVVGLLQHPLGYVYASIAVSLAAFGFLIVGIRQRRGELSGSGDGPGFTPSLTFGAGTPGSNVVTTNPSRGSATAPEPAEPDTDAPDTDGPDIDPPVAAASHQQPYAAPGPPVEGDLPGADVNQGAGPVLIMPGRPRYHVAGCRYLLGKDAAEVDVRDARDEGFTPCGVCKPDQALAHPAPDGPTPSIEDPPAVAPSAVLNVPPVTPATPQLAFDRDDDVSGPPA